MNESWRVGSVRLRDLRSFQVNYGPFYGQSRECRDGMCGPWSFRAINPQDCADVQSDLEKLCNQMDTFRGVGIVCLILTFIGGVLVLAATCCQTLTCGCCGNSLTCVTNVLFGLETMLSIVAWSFASEYPSPKGKSIRRLKPDSRNTTDNKIRAQRHGVFLSMVRSSLIIDVGALFSSFATLEQQQGILAFPC